MIHDISRLEHCEAVVGLQAEVWGEASDIVPASLLAVSAKRGGILLGAWEGETPGPPEALLGFVWSLPALLDGRLTQWSHMLGVRPGERERGIGIQLKLAQRERALAQGVDLIEWTFDPLQARNAHLNMMRLGCVATTYLENAYGELEGPLFSGTPTDRLVAEWWIRRPHVERRIALESGVRRPAFTARSVDLTSVPSLLEARRDGAWMTPVVRPANWSIERLSVHVPADFNRMQADAPDVALSWRFAARGAFSEAFSRGYRVVDFFFDRASGGGHYLLARE